MEGKVLVKNPNGASNAWKYFGFWKIGTKVCKDFAVCLKKPKIESSDYDDWLNDVIYMGTEQKCQKSDIELINREMDLYDSEAQIIGDNK